MPQGIIVIQWNNQVGPVLIAAHPPNLRTTNNLLTQIYSAHRYSSLKPGFSSLTLKNNRILSFFSGMGDEFVEVENYIVALMLRRDESVARYREVLGKIAASILGNIHNNKYKEIIPKLYEQLSRT